MTDHPPFAPAPIGRRAGAFAIDLAVMAAVAALLVGAATALVMGAAATGVAALVVLVAAAAWGMVLVGLLAWWLVFSAMQGGRGSIGQRALGLRLQDAAAPQPIGFWRAVLRNVIWALAATIVVGYFTPLFDASSRRQGWHDRAARAVVVDVRGARATTGHGASANPYVAPVIPTPGGWATPATAPVALPAPVSVPAAAPAPAGADVALAPAGADFALAPAGAAVALAPAPPAPAVPPPAQRAALYPDAPVLAQLTWDDGTPMAVYGRTRYGRNPAAADGAVTVAVRDETLSLSKTHFEIGSDEQGPWIIDHHSTNGTVLVRDGGRHPLVAGMRTTLRDGDRLELGDRAVTVGLS